MCFRQQKLKINVVAWCGQILILFTLCIVVLTNFGSVRIALLSILCNAVLKVLMDAVRDNLTFAYVKILLIVTHFMLAVTEVKQQQVQQQPQQKV